MVRVVVAFVCAVLLGGCAIRSIGIRGGAVAALGGAPESGPVTSSSNHIGGVYGMSFGGRLSDNVGLQTDVTVRHVGLTQDVRAHFVQDGTALQLEGTVESTAQIVEIPLLLVLRRRIDGPIQPFFGVGGSLGVRFSRSAAMAGNITVLDGEAAGMSLPVAERTSSSHFSEEALYGFAAMCGADYAFAQDWSLRGELRFNHDFTNDRLGSYRVGSSFNGTTAYVRSELPATRLMFVVSLLFSL